MNLVSIEEGIEAFRNGEFLLVVDAADRENEADLIMAAEKVTPEAVAFMVRYTSGLICQPMLGEQLDALELPLMVPAAGDVHHTQFTVSVDHVPGTTTGISAEDRANTILSLIDPGTRPVDLARPGHVFPLRYTSGGVLRRPGHTEAGVDLAVLAGLYPSAILCELVNDDGTMSRGDDLERFSQEHGIKMISIEDLITYRLQTENTVTRRAKASLPTVHGDFTVFGYLDQITGAEHVALISGEPADGMLVRVHSECRTGDVFNSTRCDCRWQLDAAMDQIASSGSGAVIYMDGHEGRGIGLLNKLAAYQRQDEGGEDTVEANLNLGFPADARRFEAAAHILNDLDVKSVRLLSNNPQKRAGLELAGIKVTDTVALIAPTSETNREYLNTKATKMGHSL
ncbi:MAG: 3,4-dihydroxy-2-butanone-4-phosphate synthase [Acidimicrobiia bacterium]|nr:3,4-dihydroxy-2-butanone-4-phosphate synthase [Acidimicrobiia bacterium]